MKTELFEMVDMDYLFTVITADRAVEYTGKEVYVADSIKGLENAIKEGTTRTLEGINSNLCELRFNVHNRDCSTSAYALCVPADKVKQQHKEKKYRPFRYFNEFIETTHFGMFDSICYRKKQDSKLELCSAINGFGVNADNELQFIELGAIRVKPKTLFKYFEYRNKKGDWQTFGVAEDER